MDSEERSMTANQRRAMNKRETKKRLAAKGAPAVQPRTTHPEVQAEQKEAGQEVEEDDESQEQYDSGLYGGKDESIQDPSSIAEDIVARLFPSIIPGESNHSTNETSPSDHLFRESSFVGRTFSSNVASNRKSTLRLGSYNL